jgi:hypothetical protein
MKSHSFASRRLKFCPSLGVASLLLTSILAGGCGDVTGGSVDDAGSTDTGAQNGPHESGSSSRGARAVVQCARDAHSDALEARRGAAHVIACPRVCRVTRRI